jgi:phosphatidylserine synthase
MSKLNANDKFLDLSDYGRSFGRFFAEQLKETRFTAIHVTLLFGISGLIAIYCILNQHYILASFFIILKSGIDAADGELARLKKMPSYTGRYLDSIFDIILNFFFLAAIGYVTSSSFFLLLGAFVCMAYKVKTFPNWFMTLLSVYGLGFQLLVIAFMLTFGWIEFVLPFFIWYSLLILVLIGIRKQFIS